MIGGLFRKSKRHFLCVFCVFFIVTTLYFSLTCWVGALGRPEVQVTILADGLEQTVKVPIGTVRSILHSAKIVLGPKDFTKPALSSQVSEGSHIEVTRVTEKIIRVPDTLPFKTVYKPVSSYRGSESKVLKEGKLGQVDTLYRVILQNGTETNREKIKKQVVKQPEDRVLMIRSQGQLPSRGFFTGRKVLNMQATGYDPGPRSCGPRSTGRTALGLRAGYGVVAVDPKYIPLGTRLYIEGYGYAVAGDTGRAIKGNRIDLGHDNYSAARRVGRKTVKVHILD